MTNNDLLDLFMLVTDCNCQRKPIFLKYVWLVISFDVILVYNLFKDIVQNIYFCGICAVFVRCENIDEPIMQKVNTAASAPLQVCIVQLIVAMQVA
jgi:hypothetical protein